MKAYTNIRIESQTGSPLLIDLHLHPRIKNQAVVVFAHGFKGFKDWGHWNLIAETFARAGIAFLKFNFSFNGTTVDRPSDFDDLEAFGQNNYSKELQDLDSVLNWLSLPDTEVADALDLQRIALIGHSRGGGISIVKAALDQRIKALITWASVSHLNYMWMHHELLKQQWKEAGVHFILNGRTKQQMPLYYQLVEDFERKKDVFNLEKALSQIDIPCLFIHGTADPAVPSSAAETLHQWKPGSQFFLVEEADHVFGATHPYSESNLPPHSVKLVEKSISFLQDHGFLEFSGE